MTGPDGHEAAVTGPAVEVEDLSYRYPGASRPAVDGMTFHVARGEVFGFLGPSGAGKTTTQQVLIGLLRGWQGQVRVLGRDVAAWGPALYDRIGVSFELPAGYSRLTVTEDLRHFGRLHGRRPRETGELLAAVGLTDAAGQLVGTLSKGMRTRLNLARSLVHRPDLLFLDEPTSGLDPVTSRRVRGLVAAERDRGVTVFLTTHDMATADALCDRVAVVVDGRIAACDAPRSLKLAAGRASVRVEFGDDAGPRRVAVPLADAATELPVLLASRDVETIHTEEATLDDVFVQVTGRRL